MIRATAQRFLVVCGATGALFIGCNQQDRAMEDTVGVERDTTFDVERADDLDQTDNTEQVIVVDPADIDVPAGTPPPESELPNLDGPAARTTTGVPSTTPNVDTGANPEGIVEVPDVDANVQPEDVELPDPDLQSSATPEGAAREFSWRDRARSAPSPTTIT